MYNARINSEFKKEVNISNGLSSGLLSYDEVSLLLYGLTYHYVGGKTFFKDIDQSQIFASIDQSSQIDLLSPEELLGPIDNNIDILDIVKALTLAVERALNASNSNKISHSITGGFDSRILLSIFKKLDVDMHCYTYGNPMAIDCLIGKELASMFHLEHQVHDIHFDKDSFSRAAEESIRLGESLCSLHRAHRIEAIKRESVYADTMLIGTMGGEFVKGANNDDYIVSNFVYEYAEKGDLDTIHKYMKIRGLKQNDELAREVKKVMDEQSYIKDKDNMELNALMEIAAKLHHGQNLIQYSKFIPNVHTPYCDSEYLKVLFSSKYNFLHRRKTQNVKQYKLNNPRFGSMMQQYLNKDLAKIPYANGFSAHEYLVSPYYAALKAKYRKSKLKTPPTFPLGKWMEEYVVDKLKEIRDSGSFVCDYYDIPAMMKELEQLNLPQTERFWLKYTCPIQMYLTQKIYGVES